MPDEQSRRGYRSNENRDGNPDEKCSLAPRPQALPWRRTPTESPARDHIWRA